MASAASSVSDLSPEAEDVNSTENADRNDHQLGKNAEKTKAKPIPDGGGDADDFDVWMKSRQLLKPEDQLDLTEGELTEEITKVLTTTNTNIVRNLVMYSFKEEAFIPVPLGENTVTLLELEGHALHMDSEEAKEQIEETGELGYPLPPPRFSTIEQDVSGEEEEGDEGDDMELIKETKLMEVDFTAIEDVDEDVEEGDGEGAGPDEGEGEGGEGEEGQQDEAEEITEATATSLVGSKKRKLINQFNFCERAAQTYTNPKRNVDTQTIPPPRSQFGGNVLQWVIYDSYEADFNAQQKDKEKKDDRKVNPARKDKKKEERNTEAEELNKKYLKCWQVLERMINQNIFDDIANDYRYWEDPADEYRDGEGTLLPLWKFHYEKTKKLNITDLMFNPHYYDMFAVCYGSHEFMKQPNEGSVCLFTTKNPSYPDYIIMTDSGVMCCDIHTKYPYLVAVGLYDGNVAVYNLKLNYKQPLYQSSGVNAKHTECVWEIKWGPDLADGEINFYSVSSDGRVFNWVLMQNDLAITTIIRLYLANGNVEGPDGTEVKLRACGSCMKFHPVDSEIFLIGTEEGFIYKCSTAYSSKYLMTYYAHNLSVYRLDFNRFNSNIFISCSGDWRVKIWEDMRPEPLFIFDLGSAVGDVKWAPKSSTVFAAVTTDGKVYVFDLNINKYKPICIQAVVPKRKNKLTRICFNDKLPFVIVGDDKGATTSLKLSPNLRLMVKPPKKQLYLDQTTLQTQKLEKLLSLVRELPEGEVIQEAATTEKS